ncbi:MAG: 50S ribosomal protein L3 N(5)-glutamine methyltransferase, partial [Steroidobacteraceae bacterium]
MGSTVEAMIIELGQQLAEAELCYGHGSDNPQDEAAELVLFAAGLRHEQAPTCYAQELDSAAIDKARALVERRITERLPAAYLTQRMWFAGYEFYVDERVL